MSSPAAGLLWAPEPSSTAGVAAELPALQSRPTRHRLPPASDGRGRLGPARAAEAESLRHLQVFPPEEVLNLSLRLTSQGHFRWSVFSSLSRSCAFSQTEITAVKSRSGGGSPGMWKMFTRRSMCTWWFESTWWLESRVQACSKGSEPSEIIRHHSPSLCAGWSGEGADFKAPAKDLPDQGLV